MNHASVMNGVLHIKLLGGFDVTYNGKTVDIMHSNRLKALLAFLVLHRSSHQSRQYLAFRFWPDSTETRALTNLRQVLYNLRHSLPDTHTYLIGDSKNVCWDPEAPCLIDVEEFKRHIEKAKIAEKENNTTLMVEELEHAVRWYGGDLFAECYDSWIEPIREKLKTEYIDTLVSLIDHFENERNYGNAISCAERLLSCDKLREKTYTILMRLHVLNGERGKAVEAYRECEAILRRELDTHPSNEIKDFYERLINEKPVPSEIAEMKIPRMRSESWPLIGRREEWNLLMDEWKRVTKGEIRFVSISGEPGIGKTRLGFELIEYIQKLGYITAYTRSHEAAGDLSFTPIAELLRTNTIYTHLTGLHAVQLTELSRLLPELSAEFPNLRPPASLTEKWQRRNFFEALTMAVSRQDRSVVLFFDDIHWCDWDTLEWLGYMLRSIDANSLLVLATLRPAEFTMNKQLQKLIDGLRNDEKLTEINLGALDEAESVKLANHVAGRDSIPYQSLYSESEGNPLFVIELIRHGNLRQLNKITGSQPDPAGHISVSDIETYSLPPKLNIVISARFERLDEKTRELLWLAAVTGREFRYAILIRAVKWEESVVVRCIEELLVHRIIREINAGVYDFTHDKLREVAYRSMSGARKRLLHKQIAEAMEIEYADKITMYSKMLAYHYDRAGQVNSAISYYEQAAIDSLRMFAVDEVIILLGRALHLLESLPEDRKRKERELSLLLRLGPILVITEGYHVEAVSNTYSRIQSLSVDLGQSISPPVLRSMAISHIVKGNFDEALALGEQMLTVSAADDNPVVKVEGLYVVGVSHLWLGRYNLSVKYLKEAINGFDPLFEQTHLELYAQQPSVVCQARLAESLLFMGYTEQAEAYILQTMNEARRINHPYSLCYVLMNGLLIFGELKKIDRSLEISNECLMLCEECGFLLIKLLVEILHSLFLIETNREKYLLKILEDRMKEFRDTGILSYETYFNTLLAKIYLSQGKIGLANETIERALRYTKVRRDEWYQAEIYRIKGRICSAEGAADDEIETWLMNARETARKQNALTLELRAGIDLVKLWKKTGKTSIALEQLKNIYDRFTEGQNSPELIEANKIIKSL